MGHLLDKAVIEQLDPDLLAKESDAETWDSRCEIRRNLRALALVLPSLYAKNG